MTSVIFANLVKNNLIVCPMILPRINFFFRNEWIVDAR